MTIRNWIRFFVHTLVIGGIAASILGFFIRWDELAPLVSTGGWKDILSILAWHLFVGFTFSVISQMGFFAYLTVHQFGASMFRSFWNSVQFVVIAFVLFDLVYFRFQAFADKGESLLPYISLAVLLLLVGLITAFFKAKQSNKSVFISALFFMIVVTVLEWLPVLQANDEKWLYIMLFTLLPCNSFQLLALPKYNQRIMKKSGA
ncbi:KinB-signaling pathway activation protein [Bacillus sp. B190/17]|uniref:KinB-signaling pathway activation protein n=1 Tax=Bacillus lumedeiriae TaxID=3058829 RepID=A0ABW8IBK5_9BACI